MNLRHASPEHRRRHARQTQSETPPFVFAIVFFEVVLASAFVVGSFAAASQPFGWPAAMQFLLSGCCGLLQRWGLFGR